MVGFALESYVSYMLLNEAISASGYENYMDIPKPQISSPPAAMVPAYTPQQQEQPQEKPPFSSDKHFALHGVILMLVLVGIFSIFLISLVLIPCLKRRRTPESGEDEDSTMQGSFNFLSLRERRRPIDT